MTLLAWQRDLAGLVLADGGTGVGGSLSDDEAAWLELAGAAPGLALTKVVQRWWRAFRVRAAVPLTMACLEPTAEGRLDAFLDADRRPSSFLVTEALGFLSFLLDGDVSRPHLAPVVAFERSMLVLSQAAATGAASAPTGPPPPDRPLRRHPGAATVTFEAPPAAVFASLLGGMPPPPPGPDAHVLLLAPHLPHLCRAATAGEQRVLQRFAEPGVPGHCGPEELALWAAGALVPA